LSWEVNRLRKIKSNELSRLERVEEEQDEYGREAGGESRRGTGGECGIRMLIMF
jgi:hypothetical protein